MRTTIAAAHRVAGLARFLTPGHLAWGRTASGVTMLARPGLLPRALGTDTASAARSSWTVRMLGARELALGLGTTRALRRGDAAETRGWLVAGLISDALDAVALSAAVRRGLLTPVKAGPVVLLALAATGVQGAALAGLPSTTPPAT